MAKMIKVDFIEWHRMRNAIQSMQGGTFYCEDEEGVLRRWYPPRVPSESKERD